MESLHIIGNSLHPEFKFDKAEGIFEISGNSLADNPEEIFKPALNWLKQYLINPNEHTLLCINMDYINVVSAKHFLDILYLIEKTKNGRVLWMYKINNLEMRESGEEFAEIVNIPFEFKAI
jgi:hypothetical protein